MLNAVEQSLLAIKHSFNKVVFNNVGWRKICLTEALEILTFNGVSFRAVTFHCIFFEKMINTN